MHELQGNNVTEELIEETEYSALTITSLEICLAYFLSMISVTTKIDKDVNKPRKQKLQIHHSLRLE